MDNIKVYYNENVFNYIKLGHMYRPGIPSFIFVKKGYVKINAQFNILELTAHSLVLIDTNIIYELEEYSPDVEIRVLTYHRDFIDQLSLKFNKLNAYKTIRTELRNVYYSTEKEFLTLWDNVDNIAYYSDIPQRKEDYVKEIVESFFTGLIYQFANIVARSIAISKQKMSRQHEIVLQFVNLVSENYMTEKKVDFYAQQMMMSTRHLSTILKNVTGRSALQIINEYIVNEAKALLSTTSLSIKEIASKLKFSDQYVFSHFFKKHLNISPRQYRSQF